jgi:putative ABC transport system permease protein
MFVFLECVRCALAAIHAHRLRSFLTSLGIIIGVAAVISVVGLIQGMSSLIARQFDGLGGSSVSINAKNELADVLRGKLNALKFGDVEQLRAHVPGIRDVCPVFSLPFDEVRAPNARAPSQVLATSPNYQDVHQRYTRLGRFISEADENSARRVAVIGEKLIETLHLPKDPIGHFVGFGDEWFKVIGVMEKRGEIFGISQDDQVIIPYKTGRSLIGNNTPPNIGIQVRLRADAPREAAARQISQVMRNSHRLASRDKDDFEVVESDQLAKLFAKVSNTVTLVMAGIVGVALLVGGVGIMNIMLVSVTERTREIGICKAIGARSRDILLQFLIEAVLLSVGGGVLGVALGYALGFGIGALIPDFPGALVPWWAIVLALLFSGAVGVVFGIVPATRAARLAPIEALRYE